MSEQDIIRMAIESQLIYDEQATTPWVEDVNLTPFLERFATLVATFERERAALKVEELGMIGYGTLAIAAAIRKGDQE